jgi:hypothetical protein
MRPLILLVFVLICSFPARAAEPELQWDFLRDATQKTVDSKPVMDFEPEALALNGKQVTLHGWITPFNLGDANTVTSFILTGTPGTCPFCFGALPQDFVLVSAEKPVPVDITAELVLTGRFEVTQDDPTGFYYRLRNAKQK